MIRNSSPGGHLFHGPASSVTVLPACLRKLATLAVLGDKRVRGMERISWTMTNKPIIYASSERGYNTLRRLPPLHTASIVVITCTVPIPILLNPHGNARREDLIQPLGSTHDFYSPTFLAPNCLQHRMRIAYHRATKTLTYSTLLLILPPP